MFLAEQMIAEEAFAYGENFPGLLQATYSWDPFKSIKVITQYKAMPQTWWDKQRKRTRYAAVYINSPSWGEKVASRAIEKELQQVEFEKDLSHLKFRYVNFVQLHRLFD